MTQDEVLRLIASGKDSTTVIAPFYGNWVLYCNSSPGLSKTDQPAF